MSFERVDVLHPIATLTLTPLPGYHRRSLTVMAVISLLSFISTSVLWIYISFKLVSFQLRRLRQNRREKRSRRGISGVDLSPGLPEMHTSSNNPQSNQEILNRMDAAAAEARAGAAASDSEVVIVKDGTRNAFPILVYNLLLADMQESLAYGLSVYWLVRDGIFVESKGCWAQGWFGSVSNLAASLFLLVISANTYVTVVRGYKPPDWVIYTILACLWAFVLAVNAAGVISSNGAKTGVPPFFARASDWCWINAYYVSWRLWGHYFWIMVSIGLTIILYGVIFFTLWRENRSCRQMPKKSRSSISSSNADIEVPQSTGYHPAFLVYPWVYIACITPLIIGRVALFMDKDFGVSYFCFAGSILAGNGLFNSILWMTTILFSAPQDMRNTGLEKFRFLRTPPRDYGNTVEISGPGSRTKPNDSSGKDSWWWWKAGCVRGWAIPEWANGRTARAPFPQEPMRISSPPEGDDQFIHMETVTTVAVEPVQPDSDSWRTFFPTLLAPPPPWRMSLAHPDEKQEASRPISNLRQPPCPPDEVGEALDASPSTVGLSFRTDHEVHEAPNASSHSPAILCPPEDKDEASKPLPPSLVSSSPTENRVDASRPSLVLPLPPQDDAHQDLKP